MPRVLLSTLRQIEQNFPVKGALFKVDVSSALDEQTEEPMEITVEDKNHFDRRCLNGYPPCPQCHSAVCGSDVATLCQCNKSAEWRFFKDELNYLMAETVAAEEAFTLLKASPFRQLRNAFGFSCMLMTPVNLLGGLVSLPLLGTVLLITVPTLLGGTIVYIRGAREEQATHHDAEADLFARKVSLFTKHRESVSLRMQCANFPIDPLQEKPKTKPLRRKEKRNIFANPFSHFIGGSFATMGVASSVIKLLPLAILSGPMAWVAAGVAALHIGFYFAYSRYSHLTAKIGYENATALLGARGGDIDEIKTKAKNARQTLRMKVLYVNTSTQTENLGRGDSVSLTDSPVERSPSSTNSLSSNRRTSTSCVQSQIGEGAAGYPLYETTPTSSLF